MCSPETCLSLLSSKSCDATWLPPWTLLKMATCHWLPKWRHAIPALSLGVVYLLADTVSRQTHGCLHNAWLTFYSYTNNSRATKLSVWPGVSSHCNSFQVIFYCFVLFTLGRYRMRWILIWCHRNIVFTGTWSKNWFTTTFQITAGWIRWRFDDLRPLPTQDEPGPISLPRCASW